MPENADVPHSIYFLNTASTATMESAIMGTRQLYTPLSDTLKINCVEVREQHIVRFKVLMLLLWVSVLRQYNYLRKFWKFLSA